MTFLFIKCLGDELSFQRDLLISLLKLTKQGKFDLENVKVKSIISSSFASKLLKQMENEGLLCLRNGSIFADSQSRIRMALKAMSLGADIERVSELLVWQEFEDIAAIALERNDYVLSKNVRFKHEKRRFEIDVIGCKKPLVLCIDCKHWHRDLHRSALKRIVDAQVERTNAFANSLPTIKKANECVQWERARFVPAVLSLVHTEVKFTDKTPVIPILQLQDFINQLPAYYGNLRYFTKGFSHLGDDF